MTSETLVTALSTTANYPIDIKQVAIIILSSLFVGLLISVTHIKTSNRNLQSESLSITLVILPIIVALIIYLIGNNVASAFSLAGAFSLVRFRSEPGDPKDISYIFFAMAGGLACGIGECLFGIAFTIILCLIMVVLYKTNFGKSKTNIKTLKVLVPENFDYENAFDDLFSEYTVSSSLDKVKTVDLGSLFELVYTVTLKEGKSQKQFMDKIRCRNGNLTVMLTTK